MEWCKCAMITLIFVSVAGATASAQTVNTRSKVVTYRNNGAGNHQFTSQFARSHNALLGQRASDNLVGGIDENHSLRQTQRLSHALNQKPQVIVYRSEKAKATGRVKPKFSPKSIIHIPVPEKFKKQRKRPDNYVKMRYKIAKAD